MTGGTGRSVRRTLGRALAALAAFALLFPPLYAALASEPPPLPVALPAAPPGAYRVFVVDWGYHTAVVVQQPPGWTLGPPGEERAPFVEYAWGDRRFYLESDYRPHALFATLALPTAAVLYVDGRPDPPALGGARAVYTRTVDAPTLERLVRQLEGAATQDAHGARAAPYPAAAGYAGRFYPARGAYLWAHDCNWWTARRLAAAGLARGAGGVLLSAQVGGRLQGFVAVPRRASTR